MPRLSRLTPGEVEHGARHVAMLLEQIEKRYAADMYSPNMAAAFVLYLIKKAALIDVEDLSAFLRDQLRDKQLVDWIKMHIEDHWDDFRRLIAMLPAEWLREYLISHQPTTSRESEIGTPECLCDLGIGIMREFDGVDTCDPCCGIGNYMVRLTANKLDWKYTGYDLSDRCICITKLRAHVLEIPATILNMNPLEAEVGCPGVFDKIFVEPPYGQRLTHIHSFFNNQEGALPPAFPMVKSTNSIEWVLFSKMLECLREKGRLVAIVSNGALFNMTEAPLRQYLVDRGYVESVIALPERMLSYANISISMVVMSREHHEYVKMIDATELFERGARVNVMSPLHISAVIDAFCAPASIRKDVPIGLIAQNNYQLSVQRYFMPEIQVRNGRPLASLCLSISRGAPLSREELHEKRMDVDSGVRCLTIANVQDGIVDRDMPFIDGISVRDQKYMVHSGDVILTKSMAPYKVAVVEVPEGTKILATANFFILRLNRELIDPYFLMAYLRSDAGKIQMEQVATGTTIRTVVQESLEKMLIPTAPMDVQRRFADDYRRRLLDLAEIRRKYDEGKKELENAYDTFEKEVQF